MSPPADAAGRARPNDFNGDGVEDLAVSVPWEQYGGDVKGGVHIFYSNNGETAVPDDHILTLRTDGLGPFGPYASMAGFATAAGDFNRDGFADLAISVPSYDHSQLEVNTGAVQVVYGSPSGLRPLGRPRAKLWTQDTEGVKGVPEESDAWGKALAAGDFDGDRFDDLAIGAPGEDLRDRREAAGQVTVLYGAPGGLSTRDELWTQDTEGVLDVSERNDVMAHSLAAGDLNGDGADDLAVGVLQEDLAGHNNVGAVNVLYGKVGVGVTSRGDRFFSQHTDGIGSSAEPWDMFGTILAIGDFDGDGYGDLAIGAPGEDEGGVSNRGIATVLYGSQWRLNGMRSQTLRLRQLPGVEEWSTRDSENFSVGLAAGDVNHDGRAELAIGTPGAFDHRGRVDILTGIRDGLSTTDVTLLKSNTDGPPPYWNNDKGFAHFGQSLLFGRFDTQPGRDLAVAAPGATFTVDGEHYRSAGAVHVFRARDGLLGARGANVLFQAKGGVDGGPNRYEHFGFTFPGAGSDSE